MLKHGGYCWLVTKWKSSFGHFKEGWGVVGWGWGWLLKELIISLWVDHNLHLKFSMTKDMYHWVMSPSSRHLRQVSDFLWNPLTMQKASYTRVTFKETSIWFSHPDDIVLKCCSLETFLSYPTITCTGTKDSTPVTHQLSLAYPNQLQCCCFAHIIHLRERAVSL